jgi:hypothetical protein
VKKMESKNRLGGYLQAMASLFPPSQISRSLDCIEFENIGDIHKSIKKYLSDHWYDFSISPAERKKYPGESFRAEIDKIDFHFKLVYDWQNSLEESLLSFLPNVYVQKLNGENQELVQIQHLAKYFIYMLNDELEDENINSQEIEVMKFNKINFDFLRRFFCWMILDTYIIVTNKKIYIIYFGLND